MEQIFANNFAGVVRRIDMRDTVYTKHMFCTAYKCPGSQELPTVPLFGSLSQGCHCLDLPSSLLLWQVSYLLNPAQLSLHLRNVSLILQVKWTTSFFAPPRVLAHASRLAGRSPLAIVYL